MSWPLLALYAAIRGVIFIALLLFIGSRTAVALVRGALTGRPELERQLRQLSVPVLVVLLGALLAKGALQVLSFHDPGDPLTLDLAQSVLLTGTWGWSWVGQLATCAVLLGWLRFAGASRSPGDAMTGGFALLLIWAQTGMGHAAGGHWAPGVGRLVDAAHLAGLGLWLGTLAALAIVTFPALHGDGGLPSLALVVRRFSWYARGGVALVIVSGTIAALTYAGPIATIPQSTWGRLLLFKLGCMGGLMALGWYNWRVVTPALERGHPDDRRRLRVAVRLELLLALAMLAITTMLVVSPLPGE